MEEQALELAYAEIRKEATQKAGEPGDIPRRVQLLHSIFLDSGQNHVFPEVALHGALWAYGYFEEKGKLGRLIQWRYFYSAKERAYRMGLLAGFAEAFKRANRQVFIDTYTHYYFTKAYGQSSGAEKWVEPALLATLNRMHAARARGMRLSQTEREEVFLVSLQFEQEKSVTPMIDEAFAGFSCPILTWLCMKPVVRFAYFPKGKRFWFKNFANQTERIANATQSLRFAEAAGWEKVAKAMNHYGVNFP